MWLAGKRLADFFLRKIWEPILPRDRSIKAALNPFLRVASNTGIVFYKTDTGNRAAALSFSSLLALGPLIAIIILFAGAFLGRHDRHEVVVAMDRLLRFIAPQVDLYEPNSDVEAAGANPGLGNLVDGFIKGARSSAAGVIGAVSLIVIVLLVIKSIEDVFNEIWDVPRGRPWHLRFIFYWTMLVLGAVLFFASVLLLGAGTFVNVFIERLPFGPELSHLVRWLLPLFSFQMLVALLTIFYRVIPNTHVHWRAAFAGAVVVALLLTLNNLLAFLYLRRVVLTKSLYGSVGILPILMFGLYIFWVCVLVGGQISYAVQNLDRRDARLSVPE